MPPRKRAATVPKKIDAFEQFRQRANGTALGSGLVDEPYVLDAEKGFDPPIAVVLPKSLGQLEALDRAWRTEDVFGILRVLLGSEYGRVIAKFDEYEDGVALLGGLSMAITDHFMGRGASDVPGGSRAS